MATVKTRSFQVIDGGASKIKVIKAYFNIGDTQRSRPQAGFRNESWAGGKREIQSKVVEDTTSNEVSAS